MANYLLKEDGGYLLLESGDKILLENQGETPVTIPIPSIRGAFTAADIIPSLSLGNTNAIVLDQGYTYNQSGFTYNQAGVDYGGVYQQQDIIPTISFAMNLPPTAIAQKTQVQLFNQGYVYNQAGFTYNQIGVDYGGIYNINQDISPLVSFAGDLVPSIIGYADIYSQPQPSTGKSGPGWFMFLDLR